MLSRNVKDLISGGLLLIFGASVTLYALANYPVGTPGRMGPGMFPVMVGCLTIALGLALTVYAWFQSGEMPKFRILTPVVLSLAVAAFALLIRPLGLIPAVVATIVISSIAEHDFRPVSLVGLCVVLSILVWLIFKVGLGLPISLFNWPF